MIFLRKNNEKTKNVVETMQTMQETEKNEKYPVLDMFSILRENSSIIIVIVLLNTAMLLFGYLGEINVLPVTQAILIGFIPFAIYYYIIYDRFVKVNDSNITSDNSTTTNINTTNINATILKLFLYFVFFWSLYGLIGFLPYYIKNTFYNIIDLFSKNFFGLLLSYLIYVNSLENN